MMILRNFHFYTEIRIFIETQNILRGFHNISREKVRFSRKVQNSGKFRLFGPEITFWAPRDPRTLVKWSAGVRIRVHFSGRKRREGGGVYSLLSSPPHLLLSDSPPLTPPLLTQETYSVPQRCKAPCGT